MISAPRFLLALLVPACSMPNDPVEPQLACEAFPPVLDDLRLAAGTTYELHLYRNDSYELISSDRGILSIEPSSDDAFDLVSARAGEVTLSAWCAESETVVARAQVVVAPVASIDLHYRAAPGADDPVVALAGLRGQADSIAVAYRDRGGALLRGTGAFAVRGGPAIALVPPEGRQASTALFPKSTTVDLAFVELGRGELVATVGDLERVLPIEVVAAPATLDLLAITHENGALVRAINPVPVGNYVGIDAIARTADGRYISGVPALWQTTVGDASQRGPSTELVIELREPGPIGITATVGALTATHQVVAE